MPSPRSGVMRHPLRQQKAKETSFFLPFSLANGQWPAGNAWFRNSGLLPPRPEGPDSWHTPRGIALGRGRDSPLGPAVRFVGSQTRVMTAVRPKPAFGAVEADFDIAHESWAGVRLPLASAVVKAMATPFFSSDKCSPGRYHDHTFAELLGPTPPGGWIGWSSGVDECV